MDRSGDDSVDGLLDAYRAMAVHRVGWGGMDRSSSRTGLNRWQGVLSSMATEAMQAMSAAAMMRLRIVSLLRCTGNGFDEIVQRLSTQLREMVAHKNSA